MLRIPLVLACCGLLAAPRVAAQTATVRGFVTDAATGAGLQYVNVALEDSAGIITGSATTADGLYVIAGLSPGAYVLRVSFVGYRTYRDTLSLEAREIRGVDVSLQASEEYLDELVIEADQEGRIANLTAGMQTIRPQDVERVPGPDITGDLGLFLTTLPGVVIVGDQGGQFYVRGGEPTQNLVLLDGILVYQPFHILSYYSAFPSDVLGSVDLYAGGFGARFGGRISSVITVYSC